MFVTKTASLSSTPTELTSGVTIDQPVRVRIQCTSGFAAIGDSSTSCFWGLQHFDSSHTDIPTGLQQVEIDIEPGDTVWATAFQGATVNVLFVGR